jgi:hypothetical protein
MQLKITVWSERDEAYHTFYSWGKGIEDFLAKEFRVGVRIIEVEVEQIIEPPHRRP